MTEKNTGTVATISDITDAITPLFLALHNRGILPIGELVMQYEDVLAIVMQYEDVLAKRKIDLRESQASTEFLCGLVSALHRLAGKVPPLAEGHTTPPT